MIAHDVGTALDEQTVAVDEDNKGHAPTRALKNDHIAIVAIVALIFLPLFL